MRKSVFLLASIATATLSIERSAYEVISRPRRHLKEWNDWEDAENISFDGSVAAIQALALEKADFLANNNNSSGERSPENAATPVTCDGTLTQSLLKLGFEYAVEYDPNYDPSEFSKRQLTVSDPSEIVQEIEQKLQIGLSNVLLMCKDDDPLVQRAAIVGLVRSPKDKLLQDKSCIPTDTKHACAVYEGRVTLFLSDTQEEELAKYLGLLNIKKIIEDSTMVKIIGQGLVKITFIGPELIAPYPAAGIVESSKSMSGASIAVLSAGGGTVMIFLIFMFAWRRKFHKGEGDLLMYDRSAGPEENIHVYQAGGESDEENGPSSPFSEMLPSAYRYSENMSILSGQGLSAVTEVTESDSSQQSIHKSLSGFSDEAVNESGSPNRLGIRKRKEKGQSVTYSDNILDNMPSVEESFSDEDSPNPGCDPGCSNCSAATTKLLLGISSPSRLDKDDEAFLFL